ncbi:hypothetical protein [Streptomyces sp. P17]|uniref:hypothetical protein n=1 Tax=Streptomyces sp. P17 TaxID=3074716 RepID=UPI0028F3E289|nr:hypothetical protein [Streptomyces sp. P17]MDT9698657.1 hypothetical protein [Streptomyces sp. P17]
MTETITIRRAEPSDLEVVAALGLLNRGFARIGEPDHATGAWPADVSRLTHAAARQDTTLTDLATRIAALAARYAD